MKFLGLALLPFTQSFIFGVGSYRAFAQQANFVASTPTTSSSTTPSQQSETCSQSPTLLLSSLVTPGYTTDDKSWTKDHDESLNPSYWMDYATSNLDWMKQPTKTLSGGFEKGDTKWFEDGTLNACVNCLDRHDPNKVAIIYEVSDEESNKLKTRGARGSLNAAIFFAERHCQTPRRGRPGNVV